MNLKMFTLTLLYLFSFTKIHAQSTEAPNPNTNKVKLLLIVKDALMSQTFSLATDEIQNAIPHQSIRFTMDLKYQSLQDEVSYFRLKYEFFIPNKNGTIGLPAFGITAPVLIPPVKKKKERDELNKDRDGKNGFPFTFIVLDELIEPEEYLVRISMYKYETYDDYILGNQAFTEGPVCEFILSATEAAPIPDTPVNVVTYPNPVINTLNIVYADTNTNNSTTPQHPLEVTIFNHQGFFVSQYSIANAATTSNSSSYHLDVSHLPTGTYYCELTRNGETTIKTIIKQ